MEIRTIDWTLKNDRGLDLIGNTEVPDGEPEACMVLLHGLMGYKDYGFLPVLSRELAAHGIIVHRFNFSCSGMTNEFEQFARPELFAIDTWNRQVEDSQTVLDAIDDDRLMGSSLPRFVCGHSRGGATALMLAGRNPKPVLDGVITINAVDQCCRLSEADQQSLLDHGFRVSTSSRTGQELRTDKVWLQEQLDDPAKHDVLGLCKGIDCRALVMHGTADDAVDDSCGDRIATALSVHLTRIQDGNHVLNMTNPAPSSGQLSPQLQEVVSQITSFVIANHE